MVGRSTPVIHSGSRPGTVPPMILVGLTGGIGAGKSTVSALLAAHGAVVIDADAITRDLQEPGQPVLAAIVERFGSGVLSADGRLDRAGSRRHRVPGSGRAARSERDRPPGGGRGDRAAHRGGAGLGSRGGPRRAVARRDEEGRFVRNCRRRRAHRDRRRSPRQPARDDRGGCTRGWPCRRPGRSGSRRRTSSSTTPGPARRSRRASPRCGSGCRDCRPSEMASETGGSVPPPR